MSVVWVLLGLAVVAIALVDSADTLLSTRVRTGRYWPTDIFYRLTFAGWVWCAGKIREEARRESFLSLFGPLSLLALLALWVIGQVVGWAFVWWGMRGSFSTPISSFGDSIYYSGIVYFSVGFGDLTTIETLPRVLALLEAFGGLANMGLVIGFVPTLLGAYQDRERQLLRLDALTNEQVNPMALVFSHLDLDNPQVSDLDDLFEEWEQWASQVMQSNLSFPMLGTFRSQQVGQHWVTALGVVTDAAIIVMGCGATGDRRPAQRMYRRSVRTIRSYCDRIGATPLPLEPISIETFRFGYDELQRHGFPVDGFEQSYARTARLRSEFAPWMEALIEDFLTPRGFWSLQIDELPPLAAESISGQVLGEDTSQ